MNETSIALSSTKLIMYEQGTHWMFSVGQSLTLPLASSVSVSQAGSPSLNMLLTTAWPHYSFRLPLPLGWSPIMSQMVIRIQDMPPSVSPD